MTTIIVTHENNQIDEHDFEPEIKSITIGRRSTNDVCIANLSVSGSHARIVINDDGAMVEDLNSTNGTYINGRLISRQKLNDGDDIVLGRIRVTFLMPALQNMGQESIPATASDSDTTLDDEPPLTLAEKARLHRTQVAQSHTAAPDTDAKNPAAPNGPEHNSPEHNSLEQNSPKREGPETTNAELNDARINGAGVNSTAAPSTSHTSVAGGEAPNLATDNLAAVPPAPAPADTLAEATAVAPAHDTVTHELDSPVAGQTGAVIEIKNGAKSGQVLPIDKPVTTLGRPGIQIAAIMKKPEGYFLMHIESDGKVDPPRLNSNSIGDEPVLLRSGDALNVAGIDVQFMLS